jgi:hypothetical protein
VGVEAYSPWEKLALVLVNCKERVSEMSTHRNVVRVVTVLMDDVSEQEELVHSSCPCA